MTEQPKDELLLDHEYDGIREYDNPTPGWWHAIFIGSIVFSFVYFAFYQWSPLSTNMYQSYANAELRVIKQKFGEIGELAADEQTIVEYMDDPEFKIVRPRQVFTGAARRDYVPMDAR